MPNSRNPIAEIPRGFERLFDGHPAAVTLSVIGGLALIGADTLVFHWHDAILDGAVNYYHSTADWVKDYFK